MLSSNTLFHFTGSYDALLSILEHTFWANYCAETVPFEDEHGPFGNGTPMVCFCDIPLSSTADHMEEYGEYAIGLTKDWGIKNGISPVLYTHHSSPVSSGLYRLMREGLQIGRGPIDDAIWDEVFRIMAFVKPYDGINGRDERKKYVRYYDEREWRWVPQELPSEMKYGIDLSEFVDGRAPAEKSEQLHAVARLHFQPGDIRYIVVRSEDEIGSAVEAILRIKDRFSHQEKQLLTTRVISAEQIRADF